MKNSLKIFLEMWAIIKWVYMIDDNIIYNINNDEQRLPEHAARVGCYAIEYLLREIAVGATWGWHLIIRVRILLQLPISDWMLWGGTIEIN